MKFSYNKNRLALIGVFALISSVVFAQTFPLPTNVVTGKLDNGLTYYLIPQGERGKVRVTLYSNVGAMAESPQEHGCAHVLEHMMFKGSKNYPGKKSEEALDDMGMRIGQEWTAFTSGVGTEYNFYIPENNKEYLQQSLLLFKDWILNLELDEKELDSEKKVVIEEISRGTTSAALYLNGTDMENHDVSGTKEDVQAVTLETLKAYYKKFYTLDRLAIIINGEMDPGFSTATIKKVFGDVPATTNKLKNIYPQLKDETIIDLDSKQRGMNGNQSLSIFSKGEFSPITTKEEFRQNILLTIFCEIIEQRLKQLENKVTRTATATIVPPIPSCRFINFNLKTDVNGATYSDLLNNFCYAFAQIKQHGFSQAEIDYYSKSLLQKYSRGRNDDSVDYNLVKNSFMLGNSLMTGRVKYNLIQDFILKLKPEDFVSLANQISKEHKTIVLDNTSNAFTAEMTESYILDKLAKMDELKTSEFHFIEPKQIALAKKKTDIELKLEPVTTAKLKKKTLLAENLILLEYKNGKSVILDNNKSEFGFVKLVSKYGLNSIPEEDRKSYSEFQKSFKGGYGVFNANEVSQFERAVGIIRKAEVTKYGYSYTVRGKAADLEEICQVFNLSITKPGTIDAEKFQKSNLKSKTVVDTTKVDAAALDRFLEYNKLFQTNFNASVIYIGGKFPDNIEELVSAYIAEIPVSKLVLPKVQKDTNSELPTKVVVSENFWKRPVSIVNYIFKQMPENNLTPKDEMMLVAVSQYANMRMLEIIRKKYGLVYSTGISAITEKEPFNFQSLSVRYMIDPLNIDQSRKIMLEEVLTPMSQGLISDIEVNRLKKMLQSQYLTSFYDEANISEAWLSRSAKYGTIQSPNEILKIINSIAPADIRKLMQKIIDLDKYNINIHKPESKV